MASETQTPTPTQELEELGRRFDLGGGVLDWEYLLVIATRA